MEQMPDWVYVVAIVLLSPLIIVVGLMFVYSAVWAIIIFFKAILFTLAVVFL